MASRQMSGEQQRAGPVPPYAGSPTLEAGAALQEAERLRRAGDLRQAQAICERLLSRYPDFCGALQVLAVLRADKGEHQAALDLGIRAVMLNPRDWYSAWLVGALYSKLGAHEMALRSLKQALECRPGEPGTLATLGAVYNDEREYELAVEAFRAGLEADASMIDARLGLATALMHLGDDAAAAAVLKEAIEQTSPPPLGAISALGQFPPSLHGLDILALAEQHVGAGRPKDKEGSSDHDAMLAFIKGTALQQAGRHEEAWKQFVTANALIYPKHREEARQRSRSQRAHLSEQAKRPPLEAGGDAGGAPLALFIMGPSRSGKSTLEGLVARLHGVRRGFENNIARQATRRAHHVGGLPVHGHPYQLPPWLDERFVEFFQESLAERAGSARVFTITNPGIIQDAYKMASLLPNARFAFMTRDPDDLTFRIFGKKYKRGNSYAYDLSTIRGFVEWYHGMIEMLARQIPGRSIIVRYEDMVADPRAVLAATARLCGLPEPTGEIPAVGDDRGCAEPYRKWMEEARLAG